MTTITPPFTGSYATGLQGINVSRFDLFGISVSPKMGRSGESLFLVSGSTSIDVSSDSRQFFDDSLRLPKPNVSKIDAGTNSSNVEVISDDTFRLVSRPRFRLSPPTIGIEETFDKEKIFEEMNDLDPVVYLSNPDAVAYPVVFGVDSPIDPYSFAGAIEPFSIRKVVAGTSTFVGDHDDPEPTGVRGSMSSGQRQYSSRNKSFPCSNYYYVNSIDSLSAVAEIAEFDIFDGDAGISIKMDVVSDLLESFEPFTEKTARQDSFDDVSNPELRNTLLKMSSRPVTSLGYPSKNAKSSPCGFEYHNSRGVDSITYGGLLK